MVGGASRGMTGQIKGGREGVGGGRREKNNGKERKKDTRRAQQEGAVLR